MPYLSYKYAYLLGCLYFLAVWLVLFLRLKNRRKNMLKIGFIWMWVGVMCEYLWWLRDWWHPQNITETFVGIEDFVISFTHFNVAIFVYKYVFKKDFSDMVAINKKESRIRLLEVMILIFAPSFTLYYLFGVPSYFSTGIGLLLAGAFVAYKRSDLIVAGIWTAVLFFLITFVMFLIGNLIYPDVIRHIWSEKTSQVVFLGYPVIDMAWYVILGFLMGGVYEYVFNKQLIASKNPSFKEDIESVWLIARRFFSGEQLT